MGYFKERVYNLLEDSSEKQIAERRLYLRKILHTPNVFSLGFTAGSFYCERVDSVLDCPAEDSTESPFRNYVAKQAHENKQGIALELHLPAQPELKLTQIGQSFEILAGMLLANPVVKSLFGVSHLGRFAKRFGFKNASEAPLFYTQPLSESEKEKGINPKELTKQRHFIIDSLEELITGTLEERYDYIIRETDDQNTKLEKAFLKELYDQTKLYLGNREEREIWETLRYILRIIDRDKPFIFEDIEERAAEIENFSVLVSVINDQLESQTKANYHLAYEKEKSREVVPVYASREDFLHRWVSDYETKKVIPETQAVVSLRILGLDIHKNHGMVNVRSVKSDLNEQDKLKQLRVLAGFIKSYRSDINTLNFQDVPLIGTQTINSEQFIDQYEPSY